MKAIALTVLLIVSCQLAAQTKLSLIYKKEVEVIDSISSQKIAKLPDVLYYLNVNQNVSEYFLVTEGLVDGVLKNIPSNFMYKNLKAKTITQQNNSGEFTYSALPELKWILKSETKKVLGYTVKKAVLELSSGKQLIAWYSNLQFQNGPEIYYGLPGLILEVEQQETTAEKINKTRITAISVDLSKDTKTITAP